MLSRNNKNSSANSFIRKTIKRVYTEADIEESMPSRKTQFSNRKQSKKIYIDTHTDLSTRETHIRKTFKINAGKPLLQRNLKTEPTQTRKKSVDKSSKEKNKYQIDGIAGKGTFGTVYSGHISQTNYQIAIKKVLQDKRYKNRQLILLKIIKHPCLLEMKDYFLTYEADKQYLNIVMDYYPLNLYQAIKKKELSPTTTKIYMYQILRGLNYLAALSISHRDIKPQNILVDLKKNRAAICDLGSAKQLVQGEPNLAYICSRCYRAPQLIFGATDYTCQIDMWSMGCTLVEMINGEPPFAGDSQIHQLVQIIKVIGTPSKQDIIEMNKNYDMREYEKFPRVKPVEWKLLLKTKDPLIIDLVNKMLQYSPIKRISPSEALLHPYFDELRNQQQYKQLVVKHKNIPEIFNFTEQQLKMFKDPKMIIPKWVENREEPIRIQLSKLRCTSIKRQIHRFN